MERLIFHIDVNSAYLSWTSVENKKSTTGIDLRIIPSIIGGDQSSRHGIVLAKSIPAKQYGIITGEPVSQARQKCPHLVVASPSHSLYHQYSQSLMQLLANICPDIEQVSIDECYMDFTQMIHLYQSPIEAATYIKDMIYDRLHFTVNVGISTNKILAKMASNFQKPNFVHTLFPDEIMEKMWPLPISELYMVGKASALKLKQLEINTIQDLAQCNIAILTSHLKSHGRLIWEYANGIDKSPICTDEVHLKGIGHSTTLPADVETAEEAKKHLLSLADMVGKRLRNSKQLASTITVEIKYNTFLSYSRQTQLYSPTNTHATIYKTACRLFDELWNQTPIRLLGIRTSKLLPNDTPIQLTLFDFEEQQKQQKVESALDKIRTKFGNDAIVRGSLLEKKHHD